MTVHTVTMKGRSEPIPVGKIICMGRNYVAHIEELNNEPPGAPMFFIKPATAMAPLEEPIRIPSYSKKARHELELALIMGKPLFQASEEEVYPAIAGYAVAVDVTLQDVQDRLKEKGHPWEIAKGFNGACPISEFVPASAVSDPQDLMITMRVNGEQRHNDSTKLMIYKIPQIVAAASQYFTLEIGDIVLTGTPAGVGPLEPGDKLEMEIAQVGAYNSSVAE
ncbi:MAG: fumarylacetoacetate hydrolase family protein [SAR324 cluster bacterium]|nr:fumarylacetoacetate hydrolase family protein [SAR324 cluster bacterium]MCZ6559120.1 fumarylacetoacetate hydrolase family protein [SAR324 cluster bacterium]MCZ6644712.1 fumarylacetoacetate hydrolase family protein [SAR324 cluster bacterium]MCZ6844178.1 fumarylacetoacetate hydrolase family protein [SAR324 cluster bacterium]